MTTRTPEVNCLGCGQKVDAATSTEEGEVRPDPGDVTICLRCGHLMAFAEDLTLRELTDAEMHEVAGDERILRAQHARVAKHHVTWHDHGLEPKCAPDPNYPNGIDVGDIASTAPSCLVPLPYPAKRCGVYVVECETCGLRIGVTTAGRPDDPRSVRIECRGRQ